MLDLIFDYKPHLRRILEKYASETMSLYNQAKIELFNHFNLKYNAISKELEMYINDDIEIFKNELESKINEFDSKFKLDNYISICFMKAIRSEAMRIFNYLRKRYSLKDYIKRDANDVLKETAMKTGNLVILHILKVAGYDFSKLELYDIYDSHQFFAIKYITICYEIENISKMNHTESLMNHYVYNIRLFNDVKVKYLM